MLKDFVKQEAELPLENNKLVFSKKLANVLTSAQNINEVLKSRAIFILVRFFDSENTKQLVYRQIVEKKKDIIKFKNEMDSS